MRAADVRLDIPSRPNYLALARLVVGAAAAMVPGIDEARVGDLRLVVSEMCTNAMEANWRATAARLGLSTTPSARRAGARPDPRLQDASEPIHIVCRRRGDALEVMVRDHGEGFAPPGSDPHPPAHDPSRLDHERGLGIPLVQYLADEVDFDSTPTGTTVTAWLRPR